MVLCAYQVNTTSLTTFGVCLAKNNSIVSAAPHIASAREIHYTAAVEYPFPPVGIVGAADGKNRRAFLCLRDGWPIETVSFIRFRRVKHRR